jgi:hypothetical protein
LPHRHTAATPIADDRETIVVRKRAALARPRGVLRFVPLAWRIEEW